MNGPMTPSDADRAREAIEGALREHDFCATCGEPMGIVERGAELWIECASLRGQRGLRRLFGEAFHERHPIALPLGDLGLAA